MTALEPILGTIDPTVRPSVALAPSTHVGVLGVEGAKTTLERPVGSNVPRTACPAPSWKEGASDP